MFVCGHVSTASDVCIINTAGNKVAVWRIAESGEQPTTNSSMRACSVLFFCCCYVS